MRPFVIAFLLLIAACQGGGSDDSAQEAQPDAGMPADASPGHDSTTCTPKTCAGQGAECGSISDGCGHMLDCSYCLFQSDACVNNSCVCQPYCGSKTCGDDGCGGSCGMCGSDETCSTYGQCKYNGAHTTPPAAWHCNAAYYDAGDGCDCDCGALDPDCGEAGQTLEGCTGLASPTCTSQGLCTGGGACNAVPTGPYLTLYLQNATAPSTFGGTIASGRWEANGVTDYGNASGYITGGGDGEAIVISGNTWQRVVRRVGGYPNVDENFTASISGNTLTLTRTCPTATTQTFNFTASATSMTLSQYSGGKTRVYTFSKRW